MSKLESFLADPWKTSHSAFRASTFSVQPAPENATSEVLLASLYRRIGFESIKETDVPKNGKKLEKRLIRGQDKHPARVPNGATLNCQQFSELVFRIIDSPKQKLAKTRYINITPLVPVAAVISGAARQAGNPWNPGVLIERMVETGSKDRDHSQKLWRECFDVLSISSQDDVFSVWVEKEISAWLDTDAPSWSFQSMSQDLPRMIEADYASAMFPAKSFVKDLYHIFAIKNRLTRRQWISLCESLIRIASVAHVVWLSQVNIAIAEMLRSVLISGVVPTVDEVRSIMFPQRFSFLRYGDKCTTTFIDTFSSYLSARLTINAILWHMEQHDSISNDALSSSVAVHALLERLVRLRGAMRPDQVDEDIVKLHSQHNRLLLCKSGVGANMQEFSLYVLRQTVAVSESLRGYDQGYFVRKRSHHKNSPWVVGLGPVAIFTLTHCALNGQNVPASVTRFASHLQAYGIELEANAINETDLGHQLRTLGLVVDSPDAESGMLILPPFGG